MERSWRFLEPKKVIVESLLGDLKARDPQMSDELPGWSVGPATVGWSRVGGDLGESIPKGIDAGLCEPVGTK